MENFFNDCDTQNDVHTRLRYTLCTDYLNTYIDKFRMSCLLYLITPEEKKLSDAISIWGQLEGKGVIKVNDYSKLKSLVKDMDVAITSVIEQAEKRMRSISRATGIPGEDTGSSRKRRRESDGESIDHNQANHPSRQSSLPKYDVKERKRGKVLIFCNVSVKNCTDLDGYEKDAEKLREIFRELNFSVDVLNNKDEKEILDELEKCRKKNYSDQSALICCFLSHGGLNHNTKESYFLGSDGGEIYIEDIMEKFTNEKCPSLVGKPKLFLVQACRGTERNKGTVPANQEYKNTPHLIPNFSDYLLFNSTILKHVSWVHEEDGSFFIQNFCEKMKEYHSQYDIMTICTLVIGAVAAEGNKDIKQVPEIKSTLRKLLFL